MLGWVAAVIAIVSPSQPKPAVIQSTSRSVIAALFIGANAIRCSVDDIICPRFQKRKSSDGRRSGRRLATKPTVDSYAGIGCYPNSNHLLDLGRIEIFRCLAAITAGNKEIHLGIHSAIQEGSDYCAADLFHGSSSALRVQVRGVQPVADGFVPTCSNSPRQREHRSTALDWGPTLLRG